MPLQGIQPGASEDGGGSLPTDPTFSTVTTTGAITSGGQVSSVATIGLLTSHTTTDATTKNSMVAGRHYNNASRPVALVGCEAALSGNTLYIGGGFNDVNAATTIAFVTAGNTNTANGTIRSRINTDGARQDIGISTTPTGSAGRATWWPDLNGNPFCRVGTGRIIDIGALGLTATAVQTGAYTAAAGELVLVDPSAATGDVPITIPATAAHCAVMLVANAAGRHNVTINRNGNAVNGITDTARFSMQFEGQLAQFRPGLGGYEGQLLNPPTVLRAYNFNGTGTYEVAHNATLNPGSACSFDFWVYRATNVGNQYIWLNSNLSTTGTALAFTSGSDDLLFRDNTAWRVGPSIPVGEWVHVVVAYGSSDVTFYVNGMPRVSVAANASITAFTGAKFFGGASASTDRLIGALWTFRQWASKSSAADAALLYGDGVPPIANPLGINPVLWLRGQEARTSLVDISGNALNGTLSGTVGVARAPRSLSL